MSSPQTAGTRRDDRRSTSAGLPDPGPIKSLIARAIAESPFPGAPDAVQLAGAIQEVTIETQINGASLLIVTVIDPDYSLQNSNMFNPSPDGMLPAIEVEYPAGFWWVLAMIDIARDSSQANFTMTFQDRIVSELRDHWGPKGVASGVTTRAQFIKSLVDEVGKGSWSATEQPIAFVCPELDQWQSVATSLTTDLGAVAVSSAVDQQTATAKRNKQKGVGANSGVTIKGVAATRQQLADITTASGIADHLKASTVAMEALFVAGIGESAFTRTAVARSQNGLQVGIWQSDQIPADQVAEQATAFLQGGSGFQAGGAIALSRTISDPGQIATMVEAGGQPASFYNAFLTEAQTIVAAAGLASGSADAAMSTASDVRQLTRGTPDNPDETSWDCITRLAQLVSWFAFSNGDCLYYMNGDDLIGQTPALYLDFVKDAARIVSANATYDNTAMVYRSTHKVKGRIQRRSRIAKPQTPSQLQLDLICGVDDYRAGDVFVVRNWGPVNGRWVVEDITRNVFADRHSQITLGPPLAPYPEPQLTATGGASAGAAAAGSSPAGAFASTGSSGVTYATAAEAALAALAQKQMYSYSENTLPEGPGGRVVRENGGTLFGPAPRTMDCSSFVTLCYKAAGLPDPNNLGYSPIGYTGTLLANSDPVANPVAGDICLYGPGPVPLHATIYVGNSMVVSMGRQGDPSEGTYAQMGPCPPLGFYRPRVNTPAASANPLTGPIGPLING